MVVTIDKIKSTLTIRRTALNASKTQVDALLKNTFEKTFEAEIDIRHKVVLTIAGKNIAHTAMIPTTPTPVLTRLE